MLMNTLWQHYKDYVQFEVFTAVVMKSSTFWDITPYSPLKVNRRFGRIYRLHLQGIIISQARDLCEAICLFFDREDGGDMFLRNVG
jgi:hypothetical protein